MCGISGIVDFKNQINISHNLLKDISHPTRFRGPDDEGFYIKSEDKYKIGFAHKRLSIIDLSDIGKQPMVSYSGQTVISFNGEIYNYKILKSELEKVGAKFTSTSDTEVILNAYEFWGIEKCLDKIDGMFAFALFDFKKRKLFLARDRFGEKPLYYSFTNGLISFSSDIRSFNYLPINKTINHHSLGYYLSENCTPIHNSIWNEIKKVEPGCFLIFENENYQIKKYWTISYLDKIEISKNEILNTTESYLKNSVKQQLNSDVEVGCFLSGGIDSSLTSIYAAELYHKKIKTFSVGFNNKKHDELFYAKKVADKINSEHHEINVNPTDLNIVNSIIEEYGEPFADTSQIPNYFISNFAAKHVKVVLGGDGGDEVFAGYRTYNQGLRMQIWKNFELSHPLINFVNRFKFSKKITYLHGIINGNIEAISSALFRNIGFSTSEIKKLTNNKKVILAMGIEHKNITEESLNHTNNIFDSILYSSIKTRLANDYLVKTDRASMFNSLELRSPFLDRKLIEFTSKLNYDNLITENQNKFITKKLLGKYFDNDFVYRKKQGFEMPIAELIRNEWNKEIKEVIFEKNFIIDFNDDYIKKLLNEHLNYKNDNSKKIWNLYVLKKWIINNTK